MEGNVREFSVHGAWGQGVAMKVSSGAEMIGSEIMVRVKGVRGLRSVERLLIILRCHVKNLTYEIWASGPYRTRILCYSRLQYCSNRIIHIMYTHRTQYTCCRRRLRRKHVVKYCAGIPVCLELSVTHHEAESLVRLAAPRFRSTER